MAKNLEKVIAPIKMNLTGMSNEDIISLRVQIEKEFTKRQIKFSVGEIGETIAIDFFNNKPGLDKLQRASTGTKSVDANSRKGERYSIKTIKDGSKTGTIYPDPDNKERQLVEYILIVLLNEDYELKALYRFSWDQFLRVRQWDKTMNAWYIPKTQKAMKAGETIYEK